VQSPKFTHSSRKKKQARVVLRVTFFVRMKM
jgi:hypothetical protein